MPIEEGGTPKWLADQMALLTLVRKQRREIAMLRALLPQAALKGTSHCPICFRDFPHADYFHERDAEYMKHLPPESDLNNPN